MYLFLLIQACVGLLTALLHFNGCSAFSPGQGTGLDVGGADIATKA